MSLTGKIAWNAAVQMSGKILSTVLGLVVIGMVTRALGPELFGRYSIALAFLQVFSVLVDMGLYIILVKKLSEDEAHSDDWASAAFTLRLITAVGFLIIAPLVGLLTHYPGDIKMGIAIATISTLAITLNQLVVGAFQKVLRMDKVMIAELAGRVVLIVSTIFVARIHPTVPWIMMTVAASSVTMFLLDLLFSRRFIHFRIRLDRPRMLTILRETWPIALSIGFNLVYFKADTLILAAVRPSSIVGLYGSAYKVLEVLAAFPAMFAGLLTPILASTFAARDLGRFQSVLQKAVTNLALFALPLAVGTGFVAQQVMRIVGGVEYEGAAPALTLLMIATAAIFFGNLFANTVVAVNAQRKMLWGYAAVAVGSLIGYLLSIPRFGMTGAATMTIISEVAITFAAFWVVWRATRVKVNLLPVVRILIACLPMAVFLWLTPHLALIWRLLLAVAGYTLGLILMRSFPTEILRELFSRFSYARQR
jgi:O-antigen/teichoic acid export membrane protein